MSHNRTVYRTLPQMVGSFGLFMLIAGLVVDFWRHPFLVAMVVAAGLGGLCAVVQDVVKHAALRKAARTAGEGGPRPARVDRQQRTE